MTFTYSFALYMFNSERYAYSYGGTDGWARFAYLNMSDSSHSCPGYLREVTYDGIRLCTRNSSTFDGPRVCTSATFPSNGTTYSQVCGRVIGYIYGNQEALLQYTHSVPNNTIDDYYGDGVTLTHGSVGNREHIWVPMLKNPGPGPEIMLVHVTLQSIKKL